MWGRVVYECRYIPGMTVDYYTVSRNDVTAYALLNLPFVFVELLPLVQGER